MSPRWLARITERVEALLGREPDPAQRWIRLYLDDPIAFKKARTAQGHDVRVDMRGADLRGCDLITHPISYADLSGADLRNARAFTRAAISWVASLPTRARLLASVMTGSASTPFAGASRAPTRAG
jgi:hypothetical protein